MKKDNQENAELQKECENCKVLENDVLGDKNLFEKEFEIDVSKLSLKEARSMTSELLNANKEILNELDAVKAESARFKDLWYRQTAEYENFKRRNQDLRKTAFDDGKISVITSILTIGDSLDRALSMEMDEKTKCGVELIQKQFLETLQSLSVEVINPIGEQFSPENAEAIATVEATASEQPNTIRSVFKKGYKLNGKTIRYAQVIVTN